MDPGLADKTAVISGGLVGIGPGVAMAPARERANVLIAARGTKRVQAEAAAFGMRTGGVACDVATDQGCGALFAAGAAFGTIKDLADVFVFPCSPRASCCAGSTCHVDGGMLRTIREVS